MPSIEQRIKALEQASGADDLVVIGWDFATDAYSASVGGRAITRRKGEDRDSFMQRVKDAAGSVRATFVWIKHL